MFDLSAAAGEDHGVRGLKKDLLAGMVKRLGDFEKDEKNSVATIVHPRYKRTVFRDKAAAEAARMALIRLVEERLRRTTSGQASTSSSTASTSSSTASTSSSTASTSSSDSAPTVSSFRQRMLRLR